MAAHLGQLGRVGVHLDQIAAALVDVEGKLRGGVDGGRGAGDDHAVGARRLLEAPVQDVARDRFAERHRVALEESLATGAVRRQRGEVDLVAREAPAAAEAADQGGVAVDLEQAPAAGDPVQVVDVLRDDRPEHAEVFELDEGEMAGIRSGRGQCPPQFAHGARRVQPVLPGGPRVGQEALEPVHGRLAVLGPEPAGAAKRRDAALDRQTGARQRDDVARPRQAVGGRLQGGETIGLHAAGPVSSRWWRVSIG